MNCLWKTMALALTGFWTMLPPGNGAEAGRDVFPHFPDEERIHPFDPGNDHYARWFRYGDYPSIDPTLSLWTVVHDPQEDNPLAGIDSNVALRTVLRDRQGDNPFFEFCSVAGEAAVALWLERRSLPFLGLDTDTAQAWITAWKSDAEPPLLFFRTEVCLGDGDGSPFISIEFALSRDGHWMLFEQGYSFGPMAGGLLEIPATWRPAVRALVEETAETPSAPPDVPRPEQATRYLFRAVDCGENPLPKAVGDAILSLLEELPAWPRKRAFAHRFAMLDRSGRKTSFADCADWPDWDRLEIETAHGNGPPAVLMFPRGADVVLVGGPGGWMAEIPVGRRKAIQSLLRAHRGTWNPPFQSAMTAESHRDLPTNAPPVTPDALDLTPSGKSIATTTQGQPADHPWSTDGKVADFSGTIPVEWPFCTPFVDDAIDLAKGFLVVEAVKPCPASELSGVKPGDIFLAWDSIMPTPGTTLSDDWLSFLQWKRDPGGLCWFARANGRIFDVFSCDAEVLFECIASPGTFCLRVAPRVFSPDEWTRVKFDCAFMLPKIADED